MDHVTRLALIAHAVGTLLAAGLAALLFPYVGVPPIVAVIIALIYGIVVGVQIVRGKDKLARSFVDLFRR